MAVPAQTVHTPTLEGNYTWSGNDLFPVGHLGFTSTPAPCPGSQVMNGFSATFTPNCVNGAATNSVWASNLSVAQGVSDTTATLGSIPSTLTAPGVFVVDGEYETYTGITGNVLTGIGRGAYLTTAAAHGNSTNVISVTAFGPASQAPVGGIFGNGLASLLMGVDCGTPAGLGYNGNISVFQVNCGNNATHILTNGTIVQTNSGAYNVLAPMYIAPGLGQNLYSNYPLGISNTSNVVQTTGSYQFGYPMGFSAPIYGSLSVLPVPNIPPPISYGGEAGGNCSVTYVIAGVDVNGVGIPGTAVTLTNLYTFQPGVGGFVALQGAQVAGVVTYNLYRTAYSGTCGSAANTGFILSTTNQYPYFFDTGITGDGTSPPATNNSVASSCLGSAANHSLYCHLVGSTSTPPNACSSTTYGWDYTNTAATSGATLHCYSGSTTWVASDNTLGVASINGDTTPAQHITCSGTGLTCPTAGGTTAFALTGAAGSGSVASTNYGQVSGQLNTGGSTTVSGAPNLYVLNPAWNLTQMNALFSRFNTVAITAWSINGSNVVTFTGNNSYSVGDVVYVNGFVTGTYLNGAYLTLTAASASSFSAAFSHATASATEPGTANSGQYGLVVIPPGITDAPANAFTNTLAQTLDWRKGYALQQLSQYGIKCDAHGYGGISLTSGSNQVVVGSDFGSEAVGKTMVFGTQTGFTAGALQWDWEPTITAYSYPYATLSANAPQNFSGSVTVGTNNQAALTKAFNDVGGVFPLYFPAGCSILTDTVRWNGANLIGQQMANTGLSGFPGRDILQEQDNLGITGYSISSNVATFTVNSLNVSEVLPQDVYTLSGFPTSTFFNGNTITVLSVPTATTFTAAFTHANVSSTVESGKAANTTAANTNGLIVKNLTFGVNNSIDPTLPYTHYTPSAGSYTVPAMYRPLDEFGEPANNPLAPGWGVGQANGVATTTSGSAVICALTTDTAGNTLTLPTVGQTIIFPYLGSGEFVGTVSSTSGSCSAGHSAFTLSANFPTTLTQAEWWTFATPQTLAVAIPASITYPYTITLALPFPPVPVFESNVASQGHIIINGDQFDYAGDNFGGTAGGTPTLTLRRGPTSVNGGAGDAIGAVAFPLNPCSAMYNAPYPVIPSTVTNTPSVLLPAGAAYYAGLCHGNAAISLPGVDGNNTTFGGSGFSIAHLDDIDGIPTGVNSLGNTANNGSGLIYEQANLTGSGSTFNDLRASGLMFGFSQGPAAINQYGVHAVFPTSTGNTISNCTFRTGYGIILDNFQQGTISRCDTYPTFTSPYTGITVGGSTMLYVNKTFSELDGSVVTGVGQIVFDVMNGEPGNGDHENFPVSVEMDCDICSARGTIFEGGFNIFGGSFQTIDNAQMANPSFNYGSNNRFLHLYGLNTTNNDSNVYTGYGFYNWGNFTSCSGVRTTGMAQTCGANSIQSYDGHDAWSSMFGDGVSPTENVLGGMVVPGEWPGFGSKFDSTEPFWGRVAQCVLTTSGGSECINTAPDGYNGAILIGPHQRIAPAHYILKANIKAETANETFRLLLTAQPATSQCTSPNYSLVSGTYTAVTTGWTPITLAVDWTGYTGCGIGIQFDSPTANATLDIGYFNFVPAISQLYMPLGTPTLGATCPVAGEFKVDSTYLWICKPSSGYAFGPGTWDYYGTAH
jgi:hypothetical protein